MELNSALGSHDTITLDKCKYPKTGTRQELREQARTTSVCLPGTVLNGFGDMLDFDAVDQGDGKLALVALSFGYPSPDFKPAQMGGRHSFDEVVRWEKW